jgi:hypothetical protein
MVPIFCNSIATAAPNPLLRKFKLKRDGIYASEHTQDLVKDFIRPGRCVVVLEAQIRSYNMLLHYLLTSFVIFTHLFILSE